VEPNWHVQWRPVVLIGWPVEEEGATGGAPTTGGCGSSYPVQHSREEGARARQDDTAGRQLGATMRGYGKIWRRLGKARRALAS
jgi:hypothetical protein